MVPGAPACGSLVRVPRRAHPWWAEVHSRTNRRVSRQFEVAFPDRLQCPSWQADVTTQLPVDASQCRQDRARWARGDRRLSKVMRNRGRGAIDRYAYCRRHSVTFA